MQRHLFGFLVTLAILTAPLPPMAQPPAKVPLIGWLALAAPAGNPSLLDAFRQGLRELGWVEGQTIALASRNAEGQPDRLPALAAYLGHMLSIARHFLPAFASGGSMAFRIPMPATPITASARACP